MVHKGLSDVAPALPTCSSLGFGYYTQFPEE